MTANQPPYSVQQGFSAWAALQIMIRYMSYEHLDEAPVTAGSLDNGAANVSSDPDVTV
eukprot:CAMPEP_0181434888 /NCGR_PEP_ID=MMETSP1110-20121109/20050_1 /TAXON_ID=174948 /ORGANISM="Symbiodinium sp., Strain CCMP421" /LENGTH=57 /DNA_ID=CAMNT_0023558407 /DNA_START=178 /DNA_END=352 /DNA_ORIENTATION=+